MLSFLLPSVGFKHRLAALHTALTHLPVEAVSPAVEVVIDLVAAACEHLH